MIEELCLQGLLSYGQPGVSISLGPLNVLIGPNSSGKSNLIEAIGLLHAAPRDLAIPIRQGGGIDEWLWKGPGKVPAASIHAAVAVPDDDSPLHYRLRFTKAGQRFELINEIIEKPTSKRSPNFRLSHEIGQAEIAFELRYYNHEPRRWTTRRDGRARPDESVLSKLRDPENYAEVSYLAEQFSRITVYRDWALGRQAVPRAPQPTDLPEDYLLEDASNLALVLNDLEHRPGVKRTILEKLNSLWDRAEDVTTKIHAGTVQLFLHERGFVQPIPATRLSDGTLRYLCLLAVLCHPEPPPLVCIEEPELGLHPDVLSTVAELLVEASERTQLVVTTHSDVLLSALTDRPDVVVVCEQDEAGSHLRRLEREALKGWLEKYTLGDLWAMGEIGGARW